jgi:hypothetical protein
MCADADVIDLSTIPIVPLMPLIDGPDPEYGFPPDLVDAKIICIGSPSIQLSLERGGLFIDYQPCGTNVVKRLVLGFNELAMWINEHAEINTRSATIQDDPRG